MRFHRHVGIDYSGAGNADDRLRGLQVYAADGGAAPARVCSAFVTPGMRWNWTRHELAQWLSDTLSAPDPVILGIDHAFSFPLSYMERHGLRTWDEFLADFVRHWPTHSADGAVTTVAALRAGNRRAGTPDEFRVTERWTSSAKSVFRFDVQGQVAKSTHAGLPWLLFIRRHVGPNVHVWPFDGWDVPEGKSVLAEVYPSVFRNRYPRDGRDEHGQDAYSVARWLAEFDARGALDRYFAPPLTVAERNVARLEGWILGVA